MVKSKKKILKKIPSVFFILLCFLIVFIYISLKDLAIFSASMDNYFKSGNSIFFPFLPHINILWFLSEINPNIQLSLGHLIDIIIFCQIFSNIDSFIYHAFIRMYVNIDLTALDFLEILRRNKELPIQNEDPFFKINNENDLDQYNNKIDCIKWNSREIKRVQFRHNDGLHKNGFKIKKFQKVILFKKYTYLIFKPNNNYYLFFKNISFFKALEMFRLKLLYSYPIINIADYNCQFNWIYRPKLNKNTLFYHEHHLNSTIFRKATLIIKQNKITTN